MIPERLKYESSLKLPVIYSFLELLLYSCQQNKKVLFTQNREGLPRNFWSMLQTPLQNTKKQSVDQE